MSIDADTRGRRTTRATARQRREAKRDLLSHLAAYIVVNASLIGIWVLSGGYFWPAWVMGLWGAGLLFNTWQVFRKRPL